MKVGIQLEANRKGVGIIGVIDADFLWPTHNKQVRKRFDHFPVLKISLFNFTGIEGTGLQRG